MSQLAARIAQLCYDWVQAARTPGGGLAIGGQDEQFRLLNNGIQFHELDYDDAQAANIGLTRVLLHPGLNTVVHNDHFWFWSWAAELLLGGHASIFTASSQELRSLFSTTVRAAISHVSHPDPYVGQLRMKATELIDSNARELLMQTVLVTSYLVFPLLEAVCRAKCAQHVTPSGQVTNPFTVTRSDGSSRPYGPGTNCNSVRDLLLLLRDQLGDPGLKTLLAEFGQHLATLSGIDAFDQIQIWRNASLHGESNYPTIGGTLLNLSILLCFHSLGPDYIPARDSAVERVRRDLTTFRYTGHRSSWEYYPPL